MSTKPHAASEPLCPVCRGLRGYYTEDEDGVPLWHDCEECGGRGRIKRKVLQPIE